LWKSPIFDLSHQDITLFDGIEQIPVREKVVLLKLDNNTIKKVALDQLHYFTSLKELVLSFNQITDITAKRDTTLPATLETVVLSHNQIEKLSPKGLRALKTVNCLYLDNNPITQKERDKIAKALPNTQITW
jgi:Leucine-rich repeat (LRR) protein